MQTSTWLKERAGSLIWEGLQLFQTALAGSHCSSLYSTLELVTGVQYMEEEDKSTQPPPSKGAKTIPMATVTAPNSSAATERQDATPMDTPPTTPTPSTSIHLFTPAGDFFSVTTFGIPENLIAQCQNLLEGKKIYLHSWKDCGSDSTNLDVACTHVG